MKSKFASRQLHFSMTLASLLAIVFNPCADAASFTWAGSTTGLSTGIDNIWDTNTTSNWSDGVSNLAWPALGALDDAAVFGGTSGTVTVAASGVTANALTFTTSGYTLSGGTLTLNGTTPTINNGSGINATISSVIAGVDGVTKSGTGILTISGANTYTGNTVISEGTVVVQNNAAFGANANNISVNSGAALELGGTMAANGLNQGSRVFTISGTGVGGTGVLTSTATNTQINAVSKVILGADSTFGGSQRWDMRGNTPDLNLADFTLTKTGANYLALVGVTVTPGTGNIIINQGELSLSLGTNLGGTSTNSVTVNNGGTLGMYQSSSAHAWTLNLNNGSTLRAENSSATTQNVWSGPVAITGDVTLRADAQFQINGDITGTGNLIKNNSGSMTVRGINTYTGTTTINGGTLTLDYTTNDTSKLDDASALILNGGAVTLTGGAHNEIINATTLKANTVNSITSGGNLIHLNTITREANASINLSANNIATTDNLNDATGILGTWATVAGSFAMNSTNSADGEIIAFTDYAYSLDILDDASLYQNKHVNIDSVQAPTAAITTHSLTFNTAAVNGLTLQGANSITSGAILVSNLVGANASSLSGGTLTGPSNGDLIINQQNTNAGGTLTIDSSIVDNGTTSLQKTGAGTLILSGTSSTYSGLTTIAAGNLQINTANAIGGTQITTSGVSNAALVLNDGLTAGSGKTITIAGGGAGGFFGALSTTGTSTWEGNAIIGTTTGTRVGALGTTGSLTISGNISEPLSSPSELIIRTNAATVPVILTGNNSYTGGTRLVIGSLRLGSTNALGSGVGNLTISGSTTLSSDGTSARTVANQVALEGSPIFGDTTNNGKLTFQGALSLGAADRTFTINSPVEITNTISSAGNTLFAKAGSSDLTLSAANTFGGAVTMSAGKLIVAHVNALGPAGKVININPNGTLEIATDTSIPSYAGNTGSGGTGTIIVNRATAGEAVNHTMATYFLGNSIVNFEKGANVTSGTPTLTITAASYTAGAAGLGYTKLNPVGVNLNIGTFTRSGTNAPALRLGGTSTENFITGVVSNGSAAYSITKEDSGTWELSGANTYTGATTVRQGTLILSGARTGASGGISVSDTAGLSATLNINGGTHSIALAMNIGNAPTTMATGTVNQTGGSVIFTGTGNQLLLGQGSVGNTGIYNLSGGSITTASSATRGIMLGVNSNLAPGPSSGGGIFNLSGTGVLNMTIASGATGNALLQIGRSDTGANNTTNLFNQTGGTANVGVLTLGGSAGGSTGVSATLSVTGGTFSANQFTKLSAGNANTSVITIGGTADVTLPAFPTPRGTSSTATLYFDGGTLKPSASSTAYLGGLTNAYIQNDGSKIDTNGFNITVSQNLLADTLSTGGGFTKAGTGILTMSGSNTYTGNTSIEAGTLSLGNGSTNTGLADAADVSIAASATLNLNYTGSDVIDELTINGVAKAPGIWGSVASGAPNTDPALTGTGTLTVTTGPSASAYDTWASSYGLTGLNAAFDIDHDNDGIANGLEWILGGNPTTNSAGKLPVATRNSSGDLVLTFTREEDAIAATTLKVQISTDLNSWSKEATVATGSSGPDTNGVLITIDESASPDAVTITIPAANATAGKVFARLHATKP
jgi:autotransporter-associated beta strand protein